MFNRLDSIQPMTSVRVTTSQGNCLVKIEFARALDQDTLTEMQGLESQTFSSYLFYYPIKRMFDVIVDSNYSLEEVAEWIAQMLEGHELKVKRLSGLVEKSELKSFTAK